MAHLNATWEELNEAWKRYQERTNDTTVQATVEPGRITLHNPSGQPVTVDLIFCQPLSPDVVVE